MPSVTAPGTGQPFGVHPLALDGGFVFAHVLYVERNGLLSPVEEADGLRMPVNTTIRDSAGIEVSAGNAALNAIRVEIAGGASVASAPIDGAAYSPGIDTGLASFFVTGAPTAVPTGNAGAARMSEDRLIYAIDPPRDNIAQTDVPVVLTTTVETLLITGSPGVFHDLVRIFVTSNYVTQQDPSITINLRDSTGGTIRYSFAIGEKSGARIRDYRKQTTAGGNWTAQLSAAPPAGRNITINASAEKRLS